MSERTPASFSQSAKTSDFAWPRFHFKMDDIMKKTQDKMALQFLIVDGFGCINMHINWVSPGKSADIIEFLFWCIIKML